MQPMEKLDTIRENIARVMVGSENTIDLMLCALICGGHLLVEDVPGIGKTTLISSLARSLDMSFKRIQFTPDLLPSDVTGFNIVDMQSGEFRFIPGGIMSQVVLADEINRASPKTQSALLEAMQEGQVTVDGVSHALPQPFMVLATQNPIEFVGTHPLPEAQLDRFMMCISLGYPSDSQEIDIMQRHGTLQPPAIEAVASAQDVMELRAEVDKVLCAPLLMEYIVRLAAATRRHEDLMLGVSPRGSIWLMRACKAWALMHGMDYVLPDHVQYLAEHVWAHRLSVKPEAMLRNMTAKRILSNLLSVLPVPASQE